MVAVAQGKQRFRKPLVDGKAKSSLVPLLPLDFVSHLLQAIVQVGSTEGEDARRSDPVPKG